MASIWDVLTGNATFDSPSQISDNFQRGLDKLVHTTRTEGVLPAATQLYGAAGDAFKSGAGVDDFQATAQSMQNLGASPSLARGVAAVGQATADTLNPLGYVGGTAAANALQQAAPHVLRTAKELTGLQRGGLALTPQEMRLGPYAAQARQAVSPTAPTLTPTPVGATTADRLKALNDAVRTAGRQAAPAAAEEAPSFFRGLLKGQEGGTMNVGPGFDKEISDTVPYVKNLDLANRTATITPGTSRKAAQSIVKEMEDMAMNVPEGGQLHGMAARIPGVGLGGGEFAGASPGTTAHEKLVHLAIGKAQEAGMTPFLGMGNRIIAGLQSAPSKIGQALGVVGEEALAHGRQAATAAGEEGAGGFRRLLEGVKGARNYLLDKNPFYVDQFADTVGNLGGQTHLPGTGAAAEQIYSSRAIPALLTGGAGAGATIGGFKAIDKLKDRK